MLYYLFSFGRSGHHAVMNWICEQSRPSIYYSNCNIDNNIIKSGKFCEFPNNSNKINDNKILEDKPIELNSYKLVILGLLNIPFLERFDTYINNLNIILVMRDPYNWIASRIKHGGGVHNKTRLYIPIWKQYIKICLGDIRLPFHEKLNLIDINYNKWFSSKEYRKNTADRLNIKFTDCGITYTNHTGKSRFQENELNGRKLNVLNRYKEIDVSDYIDNETKELSQRYFGIIK